MGRERDLLEREREREDQSSIAEVDNPSHYIMYE